MAEDETTYMYYPTPYDDQLERRLREFCNVLPLNRQGERPEVIRTTDRIKIVNLDYSLQMKYRIAVFLDAIYDDVCGLAIKHSPGDIVTIFQDPIAKTGMEGQARLIEPVRPGGFVDGGQLEQWVIEFVVGGGRTTRFIHDR